MKKQVNKGLKGLAALKPIYSHRYIQLMSLTNQDDEPYIFKHSGEEIELKRGQYVAIYGKLSELWGVAISNVMLTLKKFEALELITIEDVTKNKLKLVSVTILKSHEVEQTKSNHREKPTKRGEPKRLCNGDTITLEQLKGLGEDRYMIVNAYPTAKEIEITDNPDPMLETSFEIKRIKQGLKQGRYTYTFLKFIR